MTERKILRKNKVIKKGFARAVDGDTLWIDTQNDEKITIRIKDKDTRWKFYCKYVKVTIEIIDESELNPV